MLLSKHSRVMLSSPLLIGPFVVSSNSLSKGHTIQPTSIEPTSIKGPFYPEHACESMWICAIPHRSGSIDSTRASKVVSMTRCRRIVHVSTQLDILSSTHVPKIGRGGGRGEEHHLLESSKSTARRLNLYILLVSVSW